MQKIKVKIENVAPFPLKVRVDDGSCAELALCYAREFYRSRPGAPRTVAEAMDQYHVEVWSERDVIVGTDDAGFGETTEQAAELAISDLAVIDMHVHDGHGAILYHSSDVNPDNPDDQNHRLLLVRWDAEGEVHRMADVSTGFRIENFDKYNELVSDREAPDKDGSSLARNIRYSLPAKNLITGCHIIYRGVARFVIDCHMMPGVEKYGLPNMGYSVMISFADGTVITVPAELEVTHVDMA